MSQVDYSQVIPLLRIADTAAFLELAASALYCYDYVLTFSQEVRCIWQRRFSGASLLFVLNRYAVLVNRLLRLIQLVSWSGFKRQQADVACRIVWRMSATCTILMYIAIAGFSALRMYAIYNKSRRVLAVVLVMGIVNPCVSIYYNTQLTYQAMPPPFRGCGQDSSFGNPSVDLVFLVFGAVFSILLEAIVLALTWSRTADILMLLRKMQRKMGVTELLWRDGTVYFLVLITLTCLSMLSIRDDMFNNIPALTDTLSSICIARFMLNLRAISLASGDRTSTITASLGLSDLKFASCPVAGNLGAPLAFAGSGDEDGDEDFRGEDSDIGVIREIPRVSDDPLMAGLVMDTDQP